MTAKHVFLAPIARDLIYPHQQVFAQQDIIVLQDRPFPPRLQRPRATTLLLVLLRRHFALLGPTTLSQACLPAFHVPLDFTAMSKASQMLLWTVPLATIASRVVQSRRNARLQRSTVSPMPKAFQTASNAVPATTVQAKD
jgi:hypothetical protein